MDLSSFWMHRMNRMKSTSHMQLCWYSWKQRSWSCAAESLVAEEFLVLLHDLRCFWFPEVWLDVLLLTVMIDCSFSMCLWLCCAAALRRRRWSTAARGLCALCSGSLCVALLWPWPVSPVCSSGTWTPPLSPPGTAQTPLPSVTLLFLSPVEKIITPHRWGSMWCFSCSEWIHQVSDVCTFRAGIFQWWTATPAPSHHF